MKIKRSRLSEYQTKKLTEFFVAGSTALTAAELVGVNKNTATLFYNKLRQIIVFGIDLEAIVFEGPIEVDESYFGGHRKGKRGRGAAGKVPVFGLLKRNGKVYAQVVNDTKQTTLKHIIREKVQADSLVYSDKYSSYNFLNAAGFKHERVNHSKEFVSGYKNMNHINGVENFWNQAKRHMRKFNGLRKENFNLFLQECVWRFNYPNPKLQLKILRKWSKMYYKQVKIDDEK
jgi:transposase